MLIGLHGKKQAGKDTVHQRLERLVARADGTATVRRVSFADKLYESAAAALGVTADELREWKSDCGVHVWIINRLQPVRSLTVREYLQLYGTEAHRHVFGDSFWVDNVDLSNEHGEIVVVTDVRFRNEAQAIIDAGGTVVHVIGPPEVEEAGDGHASEETLPDRYIDAVLYNAVRDDNFADLDSAIKGLLLHLRRAA